MHSRAKEWVDPARDPEKHKAILEDKAKKKEEKESFEEEEAEDLINFAENLDYDKYMGDLEFRQALDTLKDRAGKISKVQDAFKDDLVRDFNTKVGDDLEERSTSAGGSAFDLEEGLEGASILGDLRSDGGGGQGRRQRFNEDGRPEWDSSTQAGDDRPQIDDAVKDTASMVLESAPQMRAIHSKESMQKIVERARQAAVEPPPANVIEAMQRDGAAPAPLIVASSDTQNRLHKPVDPSQLPYLYR